VVTSIDFERNRVESSADRRILEQLERYADKCGAAEGWLVIFDRASGKSWDEKIFWNTQPLPSGKTAHIVGC
jgi:hypothetical protein